MTEENNYREVILKKEYTTDIHNIIKFKAKEKKQNTLDLERFADNFLKENFDLELEIPIEIDGRLTRTGGAFHFKIKTQENNKIVPIKIKMSERYMTCALHDEVDGVGAILDVLKHELVHYALSVKGKDFDDGDYEFENKLKELGIGSSGATNKKKRLSTTDNVWYQIIDIYYNKAVNRTYRQNHTKKEKEWVGRRVETEIVKTRF